MNKKGYKSQVVYEKLKEMIIDQELPQGSPLSERNISHLFEASRTPVREAIKRLNNEHFIDMTPEFGALVSKVTYETIQEIYENREVLEGLAARLCAGVLTPPEKKELASLYRDLRDALKAKKYKESIKSDLQFHNFLITHCRNSMLTNMINILFDHSRRIQKLSVYTDDWSNMVQEQHFNITKYILTGNKDGAESVIKDHIASSRERQLLQLRR